MARFELILEDLENGETSVKLNADDLRTADTIHENTLTQNAAIMIVEFLKEVGLDKSELPNLGKIRAVKHVKVPLLHFIAVKNGHEFHYHEKTEYDARINASVELGTCSDFYQV